MANFPQPATPDAYTGFISGHNVVTCPQECRLSRNSPIYKKEDWATKNNVYNMDDIPNYYCAINSGPPIPHTQLPEGYNINYYFLWSNNWGTGQAARFATEDEIYQSPQSDYLYNTFNATPSCIDEDPPTNNPVPPPSGTPPDNLPPTTNSVCYSPQSSLGWFRINSSNFK